MQPRFSACYALDGTILEALFRKLKALREVAEAPFAGQLAVICDLATHLPAKLFYTDDPGANDKVVLPRLLSWLPTNSLLVFDLGFFTFTFFDDLAAVGSWFVSRLREKTSFSVQRVLVKGPVCATELSNWASIAAIAAVSWSA